ncbi:MAG: OmpA family protein [Bacteroidales bacterium]|nr:OmpA family protein [Bacteroidales bacterium]MBD5281575.1 OmpA family protein [Bacteroides sp.]MDE6034167.1 OmpA family protein [Muribaculaceae bacterium]MBD5294122.1 OmpA family protein [Bacteroides sp.]MBD5353222.1 OmpA family protein [Bacteroides sp.]
MKKIMTLALACAAMLGSNAIAQEVTYVEDPAQGYTFNKFKSNWFITAEGGVNMQFSKHDVQREWSDRFAPAFGLQVGKWFSPIMGFRGGITYMGSKGVAKNATAFGLVYGENGQPEMYKDYYKTKVGNLGINFDAMLNVTNWWCGYKPNRVYNFIAYVGGAAYAGFEHKVGSDSKWDKHFDTNIALRGGIINSFNVSKQVALSLDIRYTCIGARQEAGYNYGALVNNASAFLGVTYLFNQRTWTAPIVPVCPPAENCDPIRARLAEVEARLADTQRKLDECLRRPMPTAAAPAPCVAPLATVYFPIGSATVSKTDANVLKSVAAQMKADTSVKYDVCGWADNYTGTEAINNRLRQNRANNVKNILVKNGVNASQLDVTTNPGDKFSGKENVYLDRCVTIQAK